MKLIIAIIAAALLLLCSCKNYKLVPGNYYKYHHFHKKAPKVLTIKNNV